MKYILLSILLYSNSIYALDVEITSLDNKTPERVLYIGNSYLYYNDSLHNHVRRMLDEVYESEIDKTNYKSVTISGSRSWHHDIDHSLNYKNLGLKKPFQLVIFQGGSGETNSVKERKIFSDEVSKIVKKIKNAGAEAALYMIHAYVEPHEDTNPRMIENIKKMYIDAGNKNDALVIPVGIAFENAYMAQPNIKLHKHYDGTHPNILGTYLASCVVFSSITHLSPLNIEYSYYGEINDIDKKFLQKIAKETVEDFYKIDL
tara:strand:- start:370 stop:1149 length:780 start_codon:yes stop_codon:yes gene_type:complete